MNSAKKNSWVLIEKIILDAKLRSDHLPEDTRAVPMKMWVKGSLVDESAAIGDLVEIITITDRKISGKLVEISPTYSHSFGDFVPEILKIDRQLKRFLAGGTMHE